MSILIGKHHCPASCVDNILRNSILDKRFFFMSRRAKKGLVESQSYHRTLKMALLAGCTF